MPRTQTPQRAAKREGRRPSPGKREILIRAGPVALRARLLDTPAADRMWQALPIYATAGMRQGALTFSIALETNPETETSRQLAPGEIALASSLGQILVGCGPAPDEPVLCNVWALALDDVTALAGVRSGDRVAVLEADS